MIKVHPSIYRLLWISMAVLGALLSLGPFMLLSGDVTATNETTLYVMLISGAIGTLTLVYALRRLIWPLKPPPER